MDFIIELLIDYFSLKLARRNALKIKKITRTTDGQLYNFTCKIENTFKDYITVIFPTGQLNTKNSEKIIWKLLSIDNLQEQMLFNQKHKTSTKPKKMKLHQNFAKEYSSIVLKPNSKLLLEINTNSNTLKKKMTFEIAFRMKKLNSKIHINTIKI